MSRKSTMIPKRIAQIRFGLMDPSEIRKMSAVEVKTADTYKDDGHAYKQGLMDPHMGVIEPGLLCPTDNCQYQDSPGHFGHIQLELPVIHIGFVNLIKTALKATCNDCSNILLHSEPGTSPGSNPEQSEQDYYRNRIRDVITKHGVGSTEFSKIIKEVEKVTSGTKRKVCLHCGSSQGKIILDKPTTFKEKHDNTERKLNPRDVREWLSSIPPEHLIFIGMDKQNRPEWVVLKVLPVPPITVRPSITLDSGDRSEDDLTHNSSTCCASTSAYERTETPVPLSSSLRTCGNCCSTTSPRTSTTRPRAFHPLATAQAEPSRRSRSGLRGRRAASEATFRGSVSTSVLAR